MKILHPHQEKATEATFNYFETKDGMPLIVAPVAAGKSLLIAEFIRRACLLYPKTGFLVLTHVTELITQDAEHLIEQWPEANISFYADKLKKKDLSGQIIFGSIQSIYKQAYKIPRRIDIVIIDEAHLLSPKGESMYQSLIRDLKIINPYVKILGYTGTNFRATKGRLTEGKNRIFTDVAYQIPMLYLVEKGFLCPLVTPATRTKMSTEGISIRKGDYVESQLQAAVNKDPITKACVDEIMEHGQLRKKWLVFTAGVEHCQNVRDEIRNRGISCEMVHGKTPTAERRKIYLDYKAGKILCIVNVGCYTTGINIPDIDLMAFMRPTRSPVLYVQMGGRGMRISPATGKIDCCLLDFGGVIAELGPIDLVDAYKAAGEKVGKGDAPVKLCPNCNAVCFAGVAECQDCGYQFPDTGIKLKQEASTMAAMSNQIAPEWHNVISVSYRLHFKNDKASMCVAYSTLGGQFKEWIFYESSGTPRERAAKWHKTMCELPLPRKVAEALKMPFKAPKRIQTRQAGKYNEIIGYEF